MAKRYTNRYSMSLTIRETQIATMRYHLTPVKMAPSKRPVITSVDEDVEKREPRCTVGGSVNWHRHYGRQCRGSPDIIKIEL